MLILTSDGLTAPSLVHLARKNLKWVTGLAALVTTASMLKDKDPAVSDLSKTLTGWGLEVKTFDAEFEDVGMLAAYDCVILMGGDPFYLLHFLRKQKRAASVLSFLAKDRVLIGISAGSMVLGTDIGFCRGLEESEAPYTPEEEGYGFVPFGILPHYASYLTVYPEMKEQMRSVLESKAVVPLNNREAIVSKGPGEPTRFLRDAGYAPAVHSKAVKKMPEAVCFSLYGTLLEIDSREDERSLWEQMALFYGMAGAHTDAGTLYGEYLELTDGALKARIAAGEKMPDLDVLRVFAELYRKHGAYCDETLVRMTARVFRSSSIRYIRMMHGVDELLRFLHDRNIPCYLTANGQRAFAMPELTMFGLHEYFDMTVFSSDLGVSLPDPRIFSTAVGSTPDRRVWMIGSSPENEIIPAEKAGMTTVLFGCENGHADLVIGQRHMPALLSYLEGLE